MQWVILWPVGIFTHFRYRTRLKDEHPAVKQKKKISKKKRENSESGGKLRQSIRHITASIESLFKWPEGNDQVKIKTFTDYMLATIETLLVHQRRLTVKVSLRHILFQPQNG